MSERLKSFINVSGVKVRQSYLEQALLVYSKTLKPLGSERFQTIELEGNIFDLSSVRSLRKGSIIAEAFSELNRQGSAVDKEVQFADPTANILAQAVRCAVLAEGIRHKRASEIAQKAKNTTLARYGASYYRDIALIGAEKRRDNFKRSTITADATEVIEPSRTSRIMGQIRPFAQKVRAGVFGVLALGQALFSSFAQPAVVYADSIPQADFVTEKRAAVVGEYLQEIDGIAKEAAVRVSKSLGQEVKPASVEYGRLGVQFKLEGLANDEEAENNPERYGERVNFAREELVNQASQDIQDAEQGASQGSSATSALKLLEAGYNRLGKLPGANTIVKVSVQLAKNGGESQEDLARLNRIMEVIGDLEIQFPASRVPDVFARLNDNPFGDDSNVVRRVILNTNFSSS